MPCTGEGFDTREIRAGANIDQLQAMLCGIVSVLSKQRLLAGIVASVDWREVGVSDHFFRAWLDQHNREDAERLRREEEMARKRVIDDKVAAFRRELEKGR